MAMTMSLSAMMLAAATSNINGTVPSSMSSPTLEWIQSLPKVELHAHLSGSVKEETIKRMLIEEQEAINRASGSNQVASDESAAAALALATFSSDDRW